MKGAREYVQFLQDGIHGRLYIETGRHARGSYLHVYVLKEDFDEAEPLNGAVEVYGIISGNPGWTEEYGWLRKGPWVKDFELLVKSGQLARQAEELRRTVEEQGAYEARLKREEAVLLTYPKETPDA